MRNCIGTQIQAFQTSRQAGEVRESGDVVDPQIYQADSTIAE